VVTVAEPELRSTRPAGAVSKPLQHSGAPLPAHSIEVTVALVQRRRARLGGAVVAPLQHRYARLSAIPATATWANFENWQSGINVRNTRERRLTIPESTSRGQAEEVLHDTFTSSSYMLNCKLRELTMKMLTGQVSQLKSWDFKAGTMAS